MDHLPAPPPGVDLAQDRRSTIVVASLVTWALAFLAVGLRFLGRWLRNVDIWADDWLILCSLVPASAQAFSMSTYAVNHGFGKHIWAAPPDALYAEGINLLISELGYFATLMCVKLSILGFYWRSFKIQKTVQTPLLVLSGIVLVWGAAALLTTIFQCFPSNALWERYNPENPLDPSKYTCGVHSTAFLYSNSVPIIVIDVVLLAFPTMYIWKLQLQMSQKVTMISVLLVGFCVTGISVARLYHILSDDLEGLDITWNSVDVAILSVVEANIAIFCACLPFLRTLLAQLGIFSHSSLTTRRQKSGVLTSNICASSQHHRRRCSVPWPARWPNPWSSRRAAAAAAEAAQRRAAALEAAAAYENRLARIADDWFSSEDTLKNPEPVVVHIKNWSS